MPSNLNDAASVPAALSAFLRGVERRGALFAELQCGDRDDGDDALAAAMRAFRNHAGTLPMAEWPRRFWTLLAATPQLRRSAATARPAGVEALAGLQPLPRQALLLRLAAGLPEEEAATVLGIAPEVHQQALASACPRDASGQPDALAWRALAEAIQSLLRDLPPQRLARLARLREAAILGTRLERPASPATLSAMQAEARPRRRRWPWVVLVLVSCAAALAATWWWPQWQASRSAGVTREGGVQRLQDSVEIVSEDLPGQPPVAKFDAATAVLTHPDFELMLEPQDEAIARDADFLAWYAAGASSPSDAPEENAPEEQAGEEAPSKATGTETTDAQF